MVQKITPLIRIKNEPNYNSNLCYGAFALGRELGFSFLLIRLTILLLFCRALTPPISNSESTFGLICGIR